MFKTLNANQREATIATDNHLLVLAGAGSGKTRVITSKIAYLIQEKSISAYSILAITFTNKAALEMKERVLPMVSPSDQQFLTIATFHRFSAIFLRKFIDELSGYDRNFSIIDTDDQLRIFKDICAKRYPKSQHRQFIQKVISNWKNDFLYPEESIEKFVMYQTSPFLVEDILNIYQHYQFFLKKHNLLDFDDLIALTVKLLQNNQRCYEYATSRWRYLLIDEYQDTNVTQEKMLECFTKGGSILTAVGDDDQSIYSFRGANVDNIVNFANKYLEADVIKLEKNYRSTVAILNLANDIIQHNPKIFNKKLYTDNSEGETPQAHFFYDDREESAWVSDRINEITHQEMDIHYKDIAIFYRTNYQSRSIEEKLMKANIPYQIVGGVKFYQRKEIKDIMGYLNILINPRNINAFKRIINYPSRHIGEKSQQKIYDYLDKLNLDKSNEIERSSIIEVCLDESLLEHLPPKSRKGLIGLGSLLKKYFRLFHSTDFDESNLDELRLDSPCVLIKNLIKDSGILNDLKSLIDPFEREGRLGNVDQFIQSAEEFVPSQPEMHLVEFIQDAALKADSDQIKDKEECVKLMTVHNAKGLEFPLVFLIGMDDENFPHSLSRSDEGIQEERRLFYVATTRAKTKFYITGSFRNRKYGDSTHVKPSRFLSEISSDNIIKCGVLVDENSHTFHEDSSNGSEFGEYMDEDHEYF